jgi:hypothetical protein
VLVDGVQSRAFMRTVLSDHDPYGLEIFRPDDLTVNVSRDRESGYPVDSYI